MATTKAMKKKARQEQLNARRAFDKGMNLLCQKLTHLNDFTMQQVVKIQGFNIKRLKFWLENKMARIEYTCKSWLEKLPFFDSLTVNKHFYVR